MATAEEGKSKPITTRKLIPLPSRVFGADEIKSMSLSNMTGHSNQRHVKASSRSLPQPREKPREPEVTVNDVDDGDPNCTACLRTRKKVEVLLQKLSHAEDAYEALYDKKQKDDARKENQIALSAKAVSNLQKRLMSNIKDMRTKQAEIVISQEARVKMEEEVQNAMKDDMEKTRLQLVEERKRADSLSSKVAMLEQAASAQNQRLVEMQKHIAATDKHVEHWSNAADSAEGECTELRARIQWLEAELMRQSDSPSSIRKDRMHVAVQASPVVASITIQVDDSGAQARENSVLKIQVDEGLQALCLMIKSAMMQLSEEIRLLQSSAAQPPRAVQATREDRVVHVAEHEEKQCGEEDVAALRRDAKKLIEQLQRLTQVNKDLVKEVERLRVVRDAAEKRTLAASIDAIERSPIYSRSSHTSPISPSTSMHAYLPRIMSPNSVGTPPYVLPASPLPSNSWRLHSRANGLSSGPLRVTIPLDDTPHSGGRSLANLRHAHESVGDGCVRVDSHRGDLTSGYCATSSEASLSPPSTASDNDNVTESGSDGEAGRSPASDGEAGRSPASDSEAGRSPESDSAASRSPTSESVMIHLYGSEVEKPNRSPMASRGEVDLQRDGVSKGDDDLPNRDSEVYPREQTIVRMHERQGGLRDIRVTSDGMDVKDIRKHAWGEQDRDEELSECKDGLPIMTCADELMGMPMNQKRADEVKGILGEEKRADQVNGLSGEKKRADEELDMPDRYVSDGSSWVDGRGRQERIEGNEGDEEYTCVDVSKGESIVETEECATYIHQSMDDGVLQSVGARGNRGSILDQQNSHQQQCDQHEYVCDQQGYKPMVDDNNDMQAPSSNKEAQEGVSGRIYAEANKHATRAGRSEGHHAQEQHDVQFVSIAKDMSIEKDEAMLKDEDMAKGRTIEKSEAINKDHVIGVQSHHVDDDPQALLKGTARVLFVGSEQTMRADEARDEDGYDGDECVNEDECDGNVQCSIGDKDCAPAHESLARNATTSENMHYADQVPALYGTTMQSVHDARQVSQLSQSPLSTMSQTSHLLPNPLRTRASVPSREDNLVKVFDPNVSVETNELCEDRYQDTVNRLDGCYNVTSNEETHGDSVIKLDGYRDVSSHEDEHDDTMFSLDGCYNVTSNEETHEDTVFILDESGEEVTRRSVSNQTSPNTHDDDYTVIRLDECYEPTSHEVKHETSVIRLDGCCFDELSHDETHEDTVIRLDGCEDVRSHEDEHEDTVHRLDGCYDDVTLHEDEHVDILIRTLSSEISELDVQMKATAAQKSRMMVTNHEAHTHVWMPAASEVRERSEPGLRELVAQRDRMGATSELPGTVNTERSGGVLLERPASVGAERCAGVLQREVDRQLDAAVSPWAEANMHKGGSSVVKSPHHQRLRGAKAGETAQLFEELRQRLSGKPRRNTITAPSSITVSPSPSPSSSLSSPATSPLDQMPYTSSPARIRDEMDMPTTSGKDATRHTNGLAASRAYGKKPASPSAYLATAEREATSSTSSSSSSDEDDVLDDSSRYAGTTPTKGHAGEEVKRRIEALIVSGKTNLQITKHYTLVDYGLDCAAVASVRESLHNPVVYQKPPSSPSPAARSGTKSRLGITRASSATTRAQNSQSPPDPRRARNEAVALFKARAQLHQGRYSFG